MSKQQLLESTRAMPEKVQASVIGRLHRTLVASHALSTHRATCTTALTLLAQVLSPQPCSRLFTNSSHPPNSPRR
jgi:hypothetical protein